MFSEFPLADVVKSAMLSSKGTYLHVITYISAVTHLSQSFYGDEIV